MDNSTFSGFNLKFETWSKFSNGDSKQGRRPGCGAYPDSSAFLGFSRLLFKVPGVLDQGN